MGATKESVKPTQVKEGSTNIFDGTCHCSSEVKIGQTSVMCCNICGLPDESFWEPNVSNIKIKEGLTAEEYIKSKNIDFRNGNRSAIVKRSEIINWLNEFKKQ